MLILRVLFLALAFHVGSSDVVDGLSISESRSVQPQAKSKEAYVTLLYGGFLLGARVLGQSIRDTGTQKDLVVLCTEGVSKKSREILKSDGWIVQQVGTIKNPYPGATHFSGVYSKLHIWNMTDYERVIFLDSDILVVSNIDHLFDCGTFCASYRDSDLFNSGVLVVEPSLAVFNDMVKKVPLLPSYTHGDQGFLSEYFKDLIYASFFNWSNDARQRQPMRMPIGLNADITTYYMNDGWRRPEEEMRVIHYTLGPSKPKPWVWWTNYLLVLNQLWINVRMKLPVYEEPFNLFHNLIFWAPYPALIIFYAFLCNFEWSCQRSIALSPRILELFTSYSKYFPLAFLFLSYYLAFKVVPTTILPSHGEYVFWLWSNFFLLIFMGLYCSLCHVTRKRHDNQHLVTFQKKMLTIVLYLVFTASYILLKVVPLAVMPFSLRLKYVVILGIIHVLVCQVAGHKTIRIWTGSKRLVSSQQLPLVHT